MYFKKIFGALTFFLTATSGQAGINNNRRSPFGDLSANNFLQRSDPQTTLCEQNGGSFCLEQALSLTADLGPWSFGNDNERARISNILNRYLEDLTISKPSRFYAKEALEALRAKMPLKIVKENLKLAQEFQYSHGEVIKNSEEERALKLLKEAFNLYAKNKDKKAEASLEQALGILGIEYQGIYKKLKNHEFKDEQEMVNEFHAVKPYQKPSYNKF